MDGYLWNNTRVWIIKLNNDEVKETSDKLIQDHIRNYRTHHRVDVIFTKKIWNT